MENKRYDFSIKFTGKLNEIDVNTFIDSLGNFVVSLHQINDEIRPGEGLQITIKEIKPEGSVGIFISLKHYLIDKAPILEYVTKGDIETISFLVGIFLGVLLIRKHLKGEQPQQVNKGKDTTTIINVAGDKLQIDNRTYNIFKENQIIDAAVGKAFDTLEGDESVEGLELYEKEDKKVFEATRKDFKFLSKPAVMPEGDTRTKKEDAILTIFKVVFEKGYKWQFFYQGIKISVDIKDQEFFQTINKGAKFSKGDTLVVELHITQVYDKSVQTYINKEYIIAKVRQHIPRGTQASLDFPKEKS